MKMTNRKWLYLGGAVALAWFLMRRQSTAAAAAAAQPNAPVPGSLSSVPIASMIQGF
jgi:hypothetical protein